jgi:chromosomal replication initiator protein
MVAPTAHVCRDGVRAMTYIIRDIERAVCQRFKLTPERLRGAGRQRKIARPRQIAMYLARELTDASLP